MRKEDLTFDAVDDLVQAHRAGKLNQSAPSIIFSASKLGPLIELAFEPTETGHAPLLYSPWLDWSAQKDLRAALVARRSLWFDEMRHRGFLRTVFDPEKSEDDTVRTQFLMGLRVSAEAVGFPLATAQSLAAAIREMESNIHEHSGFSASGILAFQARHAIFEFVAADSGDGVLRTLRKAPEFRGLTDHGRALHAALQEGVSRYGKAAHRGNGFRELFRGLVNLNADLRFRSGDHALSISGPRPDFKMARLDQKAHFQGFLASVQCRLGQTSAAIH
jgi:hypothetical protein